MQTRRAPLLAAGAVAACAVAVVSAAGAQDAPRTDLTVKAWVSPKRAGTEARPRGVAIRARARLTTEAGFDPPLVTGFELLDGHGFVYNGDRYVKCSKRVLDREGPRGCPRKSIMGHARATARADTVITHPRVVFVNGGSTRLYAYTTLYQPAFVQETIVMKTTELRRGKWKYRTRATVPANLRIVAGVPVYLQKIRISLGGKPYAKDYIATTSCPPGGWRYRAKIHYEFDRTGERSTDTASGRMRCRR